MSFLDNPISMTLPGQGGQNIQLIYQDGEWTLSSMESSKEIRRLQKENDRLTAENDELKRQLDRALKLASVLKCDLNKLTQQSGSLIKFTNEETRREFMESSPEDLITRRLYSEK